MSRYDDTCSDDNTSSCLHDYPSFDDITIDIHRMIVTTKSASNDEQHILDNYIYQLYVKSGMNKDVKTKPNANA